MDSFNIEVRTVDGEVWVDTYQFDDADGFNIQQAVDRQINECQRTWNCVARRVN